MTDSSDNFMVGAISISPQHNTMMSNGHTCRLQPKAMAVLHYLAKHSDRVIGNDELLDNVWEGRVVTHSSIQKCVNALRTAFYELDSSNEYIVYFSKQGYQLVTPENTNKEELTATNIPWKVLFFSIVAVILIISGYLIFLYSPFLDNAEPDPDKFYAHQFTQVKPFASNTGRERIIEPHENSIRVAFIRDELSKEQTSTESHLFIQGTNSREWQVSIARGNFVDLAWSPSGRNLVAIDVYTESSAERKAGEFKEQVNFYTFHIFTLDYKGEKVIEKNVLSHWQGKVRGVSWWDEGTLEFVASQGERFKRSRYRYGIADQNLSMLKSTTADDKLLQSKLFNKNTAELSLSNSGEKIEFLDEHQQSMGKWSIPFKVVSMNWISEEEGIYILSGNNELSILNIDGRMRSIDYSPKVNGRIKRVRSTDKGKNIIVTVEAPTKKMEGAEKLSSAQFMEKGGGYIYSTPKAY